MDIKCGNFPKNYILMDEDRNTLKRNISSILTAWKVPNYYGARIDKCTSREKWIDKHTKDLMDISEIIINYCYSKRLISGLICCHHKDLELQYLNEQELFYSYYEDSTTRTVSSLLPLPYIKFSVKLAGNHNFPPNKKYKKELFWIPLIFTYKIESIFKGQILKEFEKNFYFDNGQFLFLRKRKEVISEEEIIQELQKIIPIWEKRRDLYKEFLKTIK